MVNVPCGFLAVPTSDKSYVPFFIKVRSADVVWYDNNSIKPLVKSILNDDNINIDTIDPLIYKFSIPNERKIIIDENNYIYFKNENNYDRYPISSLKSYNIDIEKTGTKYNCFFKNGDSVASSAPPVNIIYDTLYCKEYVWDCILNSDGFIVARANIPVTNSVSETVNNIKKYYCYSNLIHNNNTAIDNLTFNNINLPIPILNDGNINIQISKYSDINEFTNSFVGTSYNIDKFITTYNNENHVFDVINKFKIELNGINNFSTNFDYDMINCGLFVEVSGYIPIIED